MDREWIKTEDLPGTVCPEMSGPVHNDYQSVLIHFQQCVGAACPKWEWGDKRDPFKGRCNA